MNQAFRSHELQGRTVDIGGGRSPDYFSYLKKGDGVAIDSIDGSMTGIDFEIDSLPFAESEIDTAILANVLEHIYNYQHLLSEIRRVLVPGGRLIGFVPFWMAYHPDPRDYFRYTEEALERIFKDAGFSGCVIEPLSATPVMASFNTFVLSLPRLLRPCIYALLLPCEWAYSRSRPKAASRTPLGFVFSAHT